jgi:hypothetical protein
MLRHVSKVWDVGVMVREYRAWEWFDLAEADWLPPEAMPGNRCGFDAAAHG